MNKERLRIENLIGNTYQVWDDDTCVFQGSYSDCVAYISFKTQEDE